MAMRYQDDPRLIEAQATAVSEVLSERQIKALTDGEPIEVRNIASDFIVSDFAHQPRRFPRRMRAASPRALLRARRIAGIGMGWICARAQAIVDYCRRGAGQ